MKIIYKLAAILLLTFCLFVIFVMKNNILTPSISNIPDLNTITYSVIILLFAFLSGYLFNQSNIMNLKANMTKQTRKNEKNTLANQDNIDKIERLNSKIATLETALNEALKAKQGNNNAK